jgi:hypothetical protein
MAGIADTNTIDLVARDADGTLLLIMIEDRPWGSDLDQATQLQEKIHTYAGYVLDGILARQYPETAGESVTIRLDCAEAPTGEYAYITAHVANQLNRYGINFRISPRDRPQTVHETLQ